jgi:hypothetical protein
MAPPESRRPVPVREVLRQAVPGLATRMLEATIREEWAQTVGPGLARRSQPGELRAGILTVIADNSPWLQEMTLRSAELLRALQSRHGATVTGLRFTLGRLAPPAPPAAGAGPGPRARLSDEETRAVEATAAPLPDPALRASLRRLLTKDLIARRRRESRGGRMDAGVKEDP